MAKVVEIEGNKSSGGLKPGAKPPRARDEGGLLPTERMFVEHYMISMRATPAAILAGYSVRNAASIASDLLRKPHIAREIERLQAERLVRLRLMQDEALLELRALVLSDLDHYRRQGDRIVTRDGVEALENPEGTISVPRTRALSKIKLKSRTYMDEDETMVTEHETDIAVHSKTSALDMYMKHLGMFPVAGARLEIEDGDSNILVIEEIVE